MAFLEELTFYIDGEKIEKKIPSGDWYQSTRQGSICEWTNMLDEDEVLVLLDKISKSKESVIRYSGRKSRHDHTISKSDKKAIKETLELFRLFQKLEKPDK